MPINQLDSKKLERGDIYLMSYGCINIYNEVYSKGTKIGETYIGRISSATMSNLDKICYDNKYLFHDTYPMRMTLVR